MPNQVLVKVKGVRKSRIVSTDHPVAATSALIAAIASEPRRAESHGLMLVPKPAQSISGGCVQSGVRQFRRGQAY